MSADQSNERATTSPRSNRIAWVAVAAGLASTSLACRAPRSERGAAPSADAATSATASRSAAVGSSAVVAPSAAVTGSAAAPPSPAVPPSANGVTPAPGARNVLVVTIDSLRADVPWLGYGRPNAPNLTRLAESSAIYTRAYSPSSYTAKSLSAFLSGRFASTLYRDGRFFTRYSPANRFLGELLHEQGTRTVAWHSHLYFGRDSGLDQGFDVWRLVPGIHFDPETDNDVTSDKMTALGIELLGDAKNTSGRFFAWAHYMDPHDQYHAHPEAPSFGKRARDRYDQEIWFADFWIGKLFEWAERQPWWKDTVVIVSADHGEAFGEHDMYKHAFELWDVLTHVPLLVRGPGIVPRRIESRRSLVDLTPTILALFGATPPADFAGKSLLPELSGAEPDLREPILTELAEDTHNPPRRALLQGNYKLIDFGRGHAELFDLAADPAESTNVAAKHPSEFEALKKALAEKYAAMPVVAPFGGQKLHDGGRANGPTGPR